MRAMILAAGRGERLRPLTDSCPKPLVKVAGKPLIEYHVESLQRVGITELVINLGHLGEQIQDYLGNGQSFGVDIQYSVENPVKEVGGGILQALPLLGEQPFIIVNGDIWTDYSFDALPQTITGLAHLVLVDNPEHNPAGDFSLRSDGCVFRAMNTQAYTYCGISILDPELFVDCIPGTSFRLRPILDQALAVNGISGEYYAGRWTDVGTIVRLQELEAVLIQHKGAQSEAHVHSR